MSKNVEELYLIRPHRFDKEDDDAVSWLELDCAQGNTIKAVYASERPRAAKFKRENVVILMAETRSTGEIAGCYMAHIRRVRFYLEKHDDEAFVKVAWTFSLRISPNHRRLGLAGYLGVKMEEVLKKKGVTFAYNGIANDNPASMCLGQKFGQSTLFTNGWFNINVPHAFNLLKESDPSVIAAKLDPEESAKFIKENYSNSFFFPDFDQFPVRSSVFVAKKGSDSVSLVISEVFEGFTVIDVPFRYKVAVFFIKMLSLLFPRWFERPLQFGKPWRSHFIFPIQYRVKDPKNYAPLAKAAVSLAIRNYHYNTELLCFSLDHVISGVEIDDPKILADVKRSLFISPIFSGTAMFLYGKSLKDTPKERSQMEEYAKKQKFWFMDGNEL